MRIPVLLYHSISNDDSNVSLSINQFEKHMIYLQKKNFKTINFDDVSKKKEKSVIITFDDSYKDLIINALPILKKYNFIATCFAVSDFLGRDNLWDMGKNNYVKKELMSKNDLREWILNDMTVGSHTHNHHDLTALKKEEVINQLDKSKKILENIIGSEVTNFSYPYGKVNNLVYDITKKFFNKATTTNRGRFDINSHDSLLIPRIDMGKKLSIFKIFLKLHTNYEDLQFKKNELYL